MGEKSRDALPVIKGDKLILDFGKTILRPKREGVDPGERKLPPEPGRAPAEDFVPEDQVLNRRSKRED
jgi:hypothetical protein